MSAGQVTKKPFLRKGGGVKNKAQGNSGKSAAKKAEDQNRLSARAERTAELNANRSERLGTAGLRGASKGGANANAPGGKDGFAPGTSVKDRIAAWEGKTGGPGTGVKPVAKDVAPTPKIDPAPEPIGKDSLPPVPVRDDDTKDDVLDKPDPNPGDVLKKLDDGKKDPALWERIKTWVTGLLTKKDMPPAEVKKEEQAAANDDQTVTPVDVDPVPGLDPGSAGEGPVAELEPKIDVDGGGGGDGPAIPSLDDLKGAGTGLLDQGADALGDAVSQGEDMVGDQVSALEDQVGGAIGDAEGMVGDKVSEAEGMVGDKVAELEGQAGSAISDAEGAVSGKVSEMEDAVGAKVEETEGAVAKKWKESPARAAAAKLIGAENMDKVDDAIAGGYRQLKEKAKELWSGAKGAVGDKYQELKGKAGEMYQGAKDTVKGKYEELKGQAGDLYQGVKDQAGDLYQGAKDQVKGAWEGVKGFASKLKFW